MAFKIPPIKGVQDSVRRAMMDTDRRLAELEGRRPEAHVTRDGQTLIVGRSNLHWHIAGTDDPLTTVIRSSDGVYGISGVWLDATGRFSLGAGLKVDQFGNVDLNGSISAEIFNMVDLDDNIIAQFDRNTVAYSLGTHEFALGAEANSSSNHGLYWGLGKFGLAARDTTGGFGDIGSYLEIEGDTSVGGIKLVHDALDGTTNRYAVVRLGGSSGDAGLDLETSGDRINITSGTDISTYSSKFYFSSSTGSPQIEIGEWSSGSNHPAIETANFYMLMGNNHAGPNATCYIRTKGTGALHLGTNSSNDLTISNGGGVSTIGRLTVGDEIYVSNGSKTDPSYTFSSATTTGLWVNSGGTALYNSIKGKSMMANAGGRIYVYASADNGTTPNDAMWCSIGADASWGRLETVQGKFYINKEIWVDEGKISSYNEDLLLYDSGVIVQSMGTATNRNGNTVIYSHANNGGGTTSCLRLIPADSSSVAKGGTSGMLWQTTYSSDRHVHARVYYTGGDVLGFRNYENTAWVGLKASAFTIGSDLGYKNRVRKGREEHHPYLEAVLTGDRQLAFDNHRGVETIIFDDSDLETLYEWDGCPGFVPKRKQNGNGDGIEDREIPEPVFHETRDECAAANCDGRDNTIRKNHHCDDYECGGTNASPCWLIEKHVDRPGFSAQNVEEFFPKTVDTDFNGEERGIDIYGLVAELWNTVDHLIEECEDLRAAIADGPGPDAKSRPRGGNLLPKEPRRTGKRVTK